MASSARVFTLGTGAALTSTQRANTSLLVELSGRPVLVDCSGDPAAALTRIGIDLLDVRDVILTHHHVDHIVALPSLLQQQSLRHGASVRLMAPPATASTLRELLRLFGFEKKPLEIEIEVLDPPDAEYDLWDGWRLRTVPAVHGTMPVLAVVFSHADCGRIAYSADTEPTEAFAHAAAGADLVIHDVQVVRDAPAGHGDADAVARIFENVEMPKRLLPVHVQSVPEDQGDAICARLRELMPDVEILVPADGALVYSET